jgi:hypothetical protein
MGRQAQRKKNPECIDPGFLSRAASELGKIRCRLAVERGRRLRVAGDKKIFGDDCATLVIFMLKFSQWPSPLVQHLEHSLGWLAMQDGPVIHPR